MNCHWYGSASNPASGWHTNKEEMDRNPLYQLMDIRMGGSLVRLFEEDGPEAVQNYCIAEIQSNYLSNFGEGRVIEENDYRTWRQQVDSEEHSEPSYRQYQDFTANRFVRFKSHSVCWDLHRRGVMGETILHLCYHNSTPIHNEIAKILLQLYPKMANDIVEKEHRYGESTLHLAIINGDLDSVKLLVKSGANVNQQATGRFFLPEDQIKKETNNTDYVGYAYYGEYPLAFAACFGRDSIYDFLLRNGADPNLQDSLGNTVLHMVVINNQLDMYSHAVRHHIRPANTWIKNGRPGSKDGLTPLALASKLGRQHIFNEIMELHRIELWRFSNIGCSLYPLHAVDSIGIGGKTNWNSALMIVVNGETDNHLEMLQGGVIRQLLDEKWKTFVRRQFFVRLMVLALHLTLMTCAICTRRPQDLASYESPLDAVRFASEVIVVLGCISNFLLHIEELKALGFLIFFVNLKNAPSKAVFFMSCLMIIFCVPVRVAHIAVEVNNSSNVDGTDPADLLQNMEETMLIIAIPCAWCMLLFFAKGHSLTGTSVMMFYKILIGDIVRFGIIYGIFLVCFSQAFYALYRDIKNGTIAKFEDPWKTMMSLIHMTFGEFNYSNFDKTPYPAMTKMVFIFFMLVMPILLLNMLIAMMGNTYMNITAKSEKEWIRQWALIVMALERAYSKDSLLKFQDKYSVTVDNPPERDAVHLEKELGHGKVNYRALMVIKSSSKTMAKQRKDAVSNWKWMLKETLNLIREVRRSGYTGEIVFKHLFPDANQFSLYDNTLLRNKTSNMSSKRRASCGMLSEGDPDWTAAVHQLAWEKDLHLSSEAATLKHNLNHPPPLDEINTPPDSDEHRVAGPPTESTTMDYINDDELEAIIQQAEGFKTTDEGKSQPLQN
ncbi:transient receptor potential cation channel subfamily V member 5-like [Watersipora subatra]|uniref:transient receptor potential cation channel subfamily V member 5-like n=1 Tax=Watersipora subatra TaxID=2589382 RepID=UPI00355C3D5C